FEVTPVVRSQRHETILNLLRTKKHLSMQDLSATLFCSPSTLRRDLIELEKMGLIHRQHGGASLALGANIEYSSAFRETEHVAAKEAICALTRDFLANGMAVFLDSSSTVLRMCPILEQYRNITVVTNGIRTALQLNESATVDAYITGGHLKKGSTSLVGQLSASFLDGFRADLAILSCRGIDTQGCYEADQDQASIKQHMMRNAKTTLLLCDSSKFERTFFYKLAAFSQFDAVISNDLPSPALGKAIVAAGCELLH
ncbi:MAG: DeoR/GlpR family DNA-binding transcription regulator, partial [Eubacteriales bacterium]|nr:DeoR/GlpR family DNA-binding transcription regulator [Eubacteriales bacterium]